MILVLGMAGPAEGAFAVALFLSYGWLLIVAIFAVIGLLTRSRIAAGLAVILLAILTVLAKPWMSFEPVDSQDSDLIHFVRLARIFCGWWAIGVATVIASVLRAFVRIAKSDTPEHPPGQPGVAA